MKGTASTCESECVPPLLLYARCPWFLTVLIGLRLKPMLRDDCTCMDSQNTLCVWRQIAKQLHALCSGIAHGFSKQAHGFSKWTSKGREQEKDIDG